jgi:uncharacterized protein (DUF58 family)
VIVEGAFAGMHQNPHAGASIEFSEHKEYAPGDDIRRIDWKAAAKSDRTYIKRFEDETEMRTFLLVDSSASMGYGRKGVTKLAYASYLAAALAYLLAQQGDPAGLVLFDDKTRQYLPPRTRGGHIRDLLVALEAAYAAGALIPAWGHVASGPSGAAWCPVHRSADAPRPADRPRLPHARPRRGAVSPAGSDDRAALRRPDPWRGWSRGPRRRCGSPRPGRPSGANPWLRERWR